MRIDPNRPVRAAAGRRDGKASAGGVGGSFASALSVGEAPAAPPAAPLSGVAGLFSLQEIPDATAQRRQALARGDELLDRLDDLRMGLLAGMLDRDKLRDLARVVRTARGGIDDPALHAVLDEIELRAEVELAKLTSGF